MTPMESAVQIYTIINLTVMGISHLVRPRVWVDFFVFLRECREPSCYSRAGKGSPPCSAAK